MVGMDSEHDNGYEDRIYKYYYQNSTNWVLSKCEWKVLNKEYDGNFEYELGPDEVIAGNK